jgi:Coatomer epsilon subunit
VALLTQIHLIQNRTDLAQKEVQAAKRWAQDSLLINLAEAWVGLRVVCPISPCIALPCLVLPPFFHFNLPQLALVPSRELSLTTISIPSPGWRLLPIHLLRLRRARLNPDHHHRLLPNRPSSRRPAPEPPARGRGRPRPGPRARPGQCAGDGEQGRLGVLDGEEEIRGGGSASLLEGGR